MLENGFLQALYTGLRSIDLGEREVVLWPLLAGQRVLPFASLTDPVTIERRAFGTRVLVKGVPLAQRLRKRDARKLRGAYLRARRRYWRSRHEAILKSVEVTVARFRALIKSHPFYLRASVAALWKVELGDTVAYCRGVEQLQGLAVPLPNGAANLQLFIKDTEQWRRRWNERWVSVQESAHGATLNSLERHPLTDAQRRACFVDEDNVLVLAGAGTGKTSAMRAKAIYLVKAALAQPEEILMLAFGKDAQRELEARVHEVPGMENIRVQTFHSLGKRIVDETNGQKSQISILEEDGKLKAKFLDLGVEALQCDGGFRKHLLSFFGSHLAPVPNELDFKTMGEYSSYIQAHEIRSLKGDMVRSNQEREIANWLFLNSIDYEYEPAYEFPTATREYRQYHPDFYLPALDLYIEHFGIDRNGQTHPDINAERYRRDMKWKRELHKRNGTALIETYSWECQERGADTVLEEKLSEYCGETGNELKTILRQRPLEALRELGDYRVFARLLQDFLSAFKGSTWTLASLRAALGASAADVRVRVFLKLFEPLYEHYEEELRRSDSIDFNDMIRLAIERVREGRFASNYKYIMIDEFQDISPARAELVKALRDQVPGAALFCVGDDWQAIFRFAGSDVSLTTRFEETFGPTETVALDKTFRFNDRIGDVASRFVQANPHQLPKNIVSHAKSDRTEVHVRTVLSMSSGVEDALSEIAQRASGGPASVFVISRYNSHLREHREKAPGGRYPNLTVSYMTAHKSKGSEADYVVITDVTKGKLGFPSEMSTDPIVELVLPRLEDFAYAEERRLFYVALTRARNSVWLLTEEGKESPFVEELVEDGFDVSFDRTHIVKKSVADVLCPECLSGGIIRKYGRYGEYFTCSLNPLCKPLIQRCPECKEAPLVPTTDGVVCSNPDCRFHAEQCPKCDNGYMLTRNGRRGAFLGCSNFGRRGDRQCTHTDDIRA